LSSHRVAIPLARIGRDPKKGGNGEGEANKDAVKGEALHNRVGKDVVAAALDWPIVREIPLAGCGAHRVNALHMSGRQSCVQLWFAPSTVRFVSTRGDKIV
jgi:hypothetical protein